MLFLTEAEGFLDKSAYFCKYGCKKETTFHYKIYSTAFAMPLYGNGGSGGGA
jgi:hypothetical protein